MTISRRHASAFVAAAVVVAAIATACTEPLAQTSCANDTGCARGFVCALGACLNPDDQALKEVDVEVDASSSSSLPVQSLIEVDLTEEPRVDVVLKDGITARGSVTYPDGTALPALVVARPDESQSIKGRAIAPSSTGDAAGAYAMILVDGDAYRLSVFPTDEGAAPAYVEDPLVAGGLNDAMSIAPIVAGDDEVRLAGVVKAGDGAAAVGIDHLEVHVESREGRTLSSSVLTGLDGSFAVSLPVTEAPATLVVSPTVDNQFFPRVKVDVSAAEPTEGPFDLGTISLGAIATPARFHARVTGADNTPVPGATATLTAQIGAGAFTTAISADADGKLDAQLPPGAYTVVVAAPADAQNGGLFTSTQVDVPSTNEDLVFKLDPRVHYRGVVRDPDGEPLPGAAVTALRIRDADGNAEPLLAGTFIAFTGVSDGSGRFDIVLDPGAQYRISTTPPLGKNAPASSDVVIVPDGGLSQDIDLPDRAVVAGTVKDGQGAAVAGAFVRVFSHQFADERGTAILVGQAITAEDGAFAIVVPDFVGGGVQNPNPP